MSAMRKIMRHRIRYTGVIHNAPPSHTGGSLKAFPYPVRQTGSVERHHGGVHYSFENNFEILNVYSGSVRI